MQNGMNGYVDSTELYKMLTKYSSGNTAGTDHLEDPGVCSRIIFKLSYRNRVGCAIYIHLA
jgi:hypothetical protein